MTDSAVTLRARLVEQASNHCGYCQAYQHYVYETLHISTSSHVLDMQVTTRKTFGLPARCATDSKVTERMDEIR